MPYIETPIEVQHVNPPNSIVLCNLGMGSCVAVKVEGGALLIGRVEQSRGEHRVEKFGYLSSTISDFAKSRLASKNCRPACGLAIFSFLDFLLRFLF